MKTTTRTLVAMVGAVMLAGPGARVVAEERLAEVRALYAAAHYEDALAALAKVEPASAERGEAEQYRAFCLIALGRTGDAERAIEAVVAADPLLVSQSSDVSPRILAMFSDVRRRVLPEIARRAYLDGRSAFQAKDLARATKQFDYAMRVIEQAGAGAEGMDDLRILVAGFVDLVRSTADRPSGATTDPAAAPANAGSQIQPRVPGEGFIPPVAIHQELPAWDPPTAAVAERGYAGAVRVVIGPDGKVQDASLVRPVHPLYDRVLLQAARRWVYRPATRFGEPTSAEKTVEIRLTPR